MLWAQLAVFDARGLSGPDGFRTSTVVEGVRSAHAGGRGPSRQAGPGAAGVAGSWPPPATAVTCARMRSIRVVRLVKDLGLATVKEHDGALAGLASVTAAAEVKIACDRIRALANPDGPEPAKDLEQREFTRRAERQPRHHQGPAGSGVRRGADDDDRRPAAPTGPRRSAHPGSAPGRRVHRDRVVRARPRLSVHSARS